MDLKDIPIEIIEKLLTKNQVDSVKLRFDILKRVDNKFKLCEQFQQIAAEYTASGIPISPKLVERYYYKYLNNR